MYSVAYDVSRAVIQGNNEIMKGDKGFSAILKQISNFWSVQKPVPLSTFVAV